MLYRSTPIFQLVDFSRYLPSTLTDGNSGTKMWFSAAAICTLRYLPLSIWVHQPPRQCSAEELACVSYNILITPSSSICPESGQVSPAWQYYAWRWFSCHMIFLSVISLVASHLMPRQIERPGPIISPSFRSLSTTFHATLRYLHVHRRLRNEHLLPRPT